MHNLLGDLQPDPERIKLVSCAWPLIHSRAWSALDTMHSGTSTCKYLQAPIPRPNQSTQRERAHAMGSHISPAPQTGTLLTCKYRWDKTTEAQGIWAALQSKRDQWQCARMLTQATAHISAVTRDSSTTSCRDLSSQYALQPYHYTFLSAAHQPSIVVLPA